MVFLSQLKILPTVSEHYGKNKPDKRVNSEICNSPRSDHHHLEHEERAFHRGCASGSQT